MENRKIEGIELECSLYRGIVGRHLGEGEGLDIETKKVGR